LAPLLDILPLPLRTQDAQHLPLTDAVVAQPQHAPQITLKPLVRVWALDGDAGSIPAAIASIVIQRTRQLPRLLCHSNRRPERPRCLPQQIVPLGDLVSRAVLARLQAKAECNIGGDTLRDLIECIRDMSSFVSIQQHAVAEVGGNRPKVLADGGTHGASV